MKFLSEPKTDTKFKASILCFGFNFPKSNCSLIKMENWGLYELATSLLPGKGLLEADSLEKELFDRHYEFVHVMERIALEPNVMTYYNNKWPVLKGYRAAMYCNIISCLNLKQVKNFGPFKGHYNTSWKVGVKDIKGYLESENNRQEILARTFIQQQQQANAGSFQCAPVFETRPLCVIIGPTPEESAVLIIYKEIGEWHAILKFPKEQSEYKPPNLVFYVLRNLDIKRFRIIPGNAENLPGIVSDEIKDCYEIIGSMFDDPGKLELWKRLDILPELNFKVNLKRKNLKLR